MLEYAWARRYEDPWGDWPSWGVILGEPNDKGQHLVVLDTDTPEAEARLVTELEQTEGGARWAERTLTVRTRRGRHRYGWTSLPAVTCKPWGTDGGLDVKGRGGYAVGPGCPHPAGSFYRDVTGPRGTARTSGPQFPGAIYHGVEPDILRPGRWVATWSHIAEVPPALIDVERCRRRSHDRPDGDLRVVNELSPVSARQRIDGALRALRAAPMGDRDNACNRTTYTVAGLLVRVPEVERVGALDPERVREEILAAAMSTGLPRSAADKKHAWRDGWGDPVAAAPDRPRTTKTGGA